ncbi:MAG: TSUP family transporter, partial [Planctomycetota bacterium]
MAASRLFDLDLPMLVASSDLFTFSPWPWAGVAVLGLVAGVLGGMLGVGGSVVMIPGLVVLLGRATGAEQHLYQASAMIANVAVSVPAALRHRRAGAIDPGVLRWMLPAAAGCVVVGVTLSNLPVFRGADGGVWLGRVLAVFLVYVVIVNVLKLRPRGTRVEPSVGHVEAKRAT